MMKPDSEFNHLPLSGWFPGHMLKAGRQMREILKLVDLVVELVDARLPLSSRNPEFRELLPGKPVILVANKADLANPQDSRAWKEHFSTHGDTVLFTDSRRRGDTGSLLAEWRRVALAQRRARGARRALTRPLRVMIVGIPNVGKSTLVNRLADGRRAMVGPKPGVTRQQQWIPLREGIELLDTPGVLWPRIRDKAHELKLGLLGTIPDDVLDRVLLVEFLWNVLRENRDKVNWDLYDLQDCPATAHDLMGAAAKRRGLLRAGGEADAERTATALLKDFRSARIGNLTLETPPPKPDDDGVARMPQ